MSLTYLIAYLLLSTRIPRVNIAIQSPNTAILHQNIQTLALSMKTALRIIRMVKVEIGDCLWERVEATFILGITL